jgi:hypothetical protein
VRRWSENSDTTGQQHTCNEEWTKDFTEVTMAALKKKPKATKCSDNHTISLIDQTAKMRMYLEKISTYLKEEKELQMQLEC